MKLMIFSEDIYFIEVFSTYAGKNCPEIEFFFFSDKKKAEEFLEERSGSLSAVLADEDFLKTVQPQVKLKAAICSKTVLDREADIQKLNIYQQGADIIGDIKKILAAFSDEALTFTQGSMGNIAAFFSTQGGSGKTTLAYMTAVQLAKNHQTAYLNFEENPYVDHLYSQSFEAGMEELLFAVKDKRSLAPVLLGAMKKNSHNVYVLPLTRSISDLEAINGEDVEYLLRAMMEMAEIEYLILDISTGFSEMNRKILELSRTIFMVYGADGTGMGKMQYFLSDPALARQPYQGRLRYVLNKCPHKVEDPRYVAVFPYSQSMAQGVAVTSALNANGEFVKGCNEMIELMEN